MHMNSPILWQCAQDPYKSKPDRVPVLGCKSRQWHHPHPRNYLQLTTSHRGRYSFSTGVFLGIPNHTSGQAPCPSVKWIQRYYYFLIICLVSGFKLFCVCLYVSLCIYICMCFFYSSPSFFFLFVSLFILFLFLFSIFYLCVCFLGVEGIGRVGKWKRFGKRWERKPWSEYITWKLPWFFN